MSLGFRIHKEGSGFLGWGIFVVLGNAIHDSPPILEMQLGDVWICQCMSQTVFLMVVFN